MGLATLARRGYSSFLLRVIRIDYETSATTIAFLTARRTPHLRGGGAPQMADSCSPSGDSRSSGITNEKIGVLVRP